MLWKPLPSAYAEAPRKLLLYTFRARVKSSVSRTFSAVATDGAPSLNSSVPIDVGTWSGVTSDGGIVAGDCARAEPARTDAASVPATMLTRANRWLMLASPLRGAVASVKAGSPEQDGDSGGHLTSWGIRRGIGPWS